MSAKTKPTPYESQREVAALRERLAERDAEIERLRDNAHRAVCAWCGGVFEVNAVGLITEHIETCEKRKDAYLRDLAAAEVREKELRRICQLAIDFGSTTPEEWNAIAKEIANVLSAPMDTRALEALLAKAAKQGLAHLRMNSSDEEVAAIVKQLLSGGGA